MPRAERGRYVDIARGILRSAVRPMTAREMVEEALKQGTLEPTGPNLVTSFDTSLTEFVRSHPEGGIIREFDQGEKRARRGSVRFRSSDMAAPDAPALPAREKPETPSARTAAKEAVRSVLTSVKQVLSLEDMPKLSEADTKANFIEPVIAALGWTGIGVVVREYYVKNSQELIDYVMKEKSQALLAVEAKALQIDLTEKFGAQVVQYCTIEGIRWAALWNGRELRLYNTYLPGDLGLEARASA